MPPSVSACRSSGTTTSQPISVTTVVAITITATIIRIIARLPATARRRCVAGSLDSVAETHERSARPRHRGRAARGPRAAAAPVRAPRIPRTCGARRIGPLGCDRCVICGRGVSERVIFDRRRRGFDGWNRLGDHTGRWCDALRRCARWRRNFDGGFRRRRSGCDLGDDCARRVVATPALHGLRGRELDHIAGHARLHDLHRPCEHAHAQLCAAYRNLRVAIHGDLA